MKKRNLFLSLFLLVLFAVSCQKQSAIKIDEPKQSEQLSAEVSSALAENDLENLKLTFELLSPEEKFEYWKARISFVARTNDFSAEQMNLVRLLSSGIRTSYFQNDKSEVSKVDDFSRVWFSKASQIFSARELGLLTLLIPINMAKNTSPLNSIQTEEDPRDDGAKCKCLVDATVNHCAFYGRSCVENTGCVVQDIGCGFLGQKKCDGRCDGW